jgi:glycosyltransferase involved in cell wall biosynthesis
VARRLRVLLVASHPVQYAAPLYRRYEQDERIDVTVAYCSMRGSEVSEDRDLGVTFAWDVPLLEGYRWIHPPDRSGSALKSVLGSANPGLWAKIREGAFDVVVCYGYRSASFWIAAAAARASGARLVWMTDATQLAPRGTGPLDRWKSPVKRLVLPRLFRTGDGVLVPSSRSVAFISSLGVDPSRVFMAPYVVDNEHFERGAAAADPATVRTRWGLPEDAFVAIFVGKLVQWKRPGDLLDAAARLPEVSVVFAGDGVLRTQLERRAACLDMTERVRFLGFVNQSSLPATYRASDVLVLPSEYEPFGLVVNEAFASGIPAIASSACGATGDLVRDNETGFTYPCGDVPALAERLSRLASDFGLRDRLADGARRRISQWGPEQNAEAFARTLLQLMRLAR